MILTEEILLLQKRAGIINETEYKQKLEELLLEGENLNLVKDPKILALAAKIVKEPINKIEDKVEKALTGNEEKSKEEVNEALALTLALALPMLLEAGGSLADLIKQKFGLTKEQALEYTKWKTRRKELKRTIDSYGDPEENVKLTDPKEKEKYDKMIKQLKAMDEEGDKQFGSEFGDKLTKAGHGLHKIYTSPIRALLWVISKFTPKDSDLRKEEIREKIANIIYATGMVVFAGVGIFDSLKGLAGVSQAATAILDGAKGGKSVSEIISDVPIVANALAS